MTQAPSGGAPPNWAQAGTRTLPRPYQRPVGAKRPDLALERRFGYSVHTIIQNRNPVVQPIDTLAFGTPDAPQFATLLNSTGRTAIRPRDAINGHNDVSGDKLRNRVGFAALFLLTALTAVAQTPAIRRARPQGSEARPSTWRWRRPLPERSAACGFQPTAHACSRSPPAAAYLKPRTSRPGPPPRLLRRRLIGRRERKSICTRRFPGGNMRSALTSSVLTTPEAPGPTSPRSVTRR